MRRYGRRKKIMAGGIAILVALVVGGLFTADYAVNRVMDLFVAGMDAEANVDSTKEEVTEAAKPFESGSLDAGAGSPSRASDDKKDQPEPPPSSQDAEKQLENTKPQLVQSVTGKPGGPVTKEQVAKVKDNLTVSDKASVVKVVLKNLSMADMKRLRAMAEGGLSLDEKKDAKRLLLGKLSSDEYNELSSLAKKYGISRGRSYEEAKQENP
ncbi:hypothetical protein [Cohnella lupini]|uniref:Uncharacterized protein n=1 Tax=Cohnella lupini TaxID=1294267 RepID=A0A3D9HZD7_9BACL|nr:hypothetical protein [Cohnella lupini]RED54843.1 hypothetical protein DFP95_121100 [Cohnella lupini]